MTLSQLVEAAVEQAGRSVEPSARVMTDVRLVHAANPDAANPDAAARPVLSVVHDSRHVESGSLYCAVPGALFDGHDFAHDAVSAGAVAVLAERELSEVAASQIVVSHVRSAMPWLASAFHREPSRSVPVVGVTGTNGKTTTTHLLASIVAAAGKQATVIGTLSGAHTTPEAPILQAQLAAAAASNSDLVAIEVSSHALDQQRTDGTHFAVAVFTNLSVDHLDYHHTMDDYFDAKSALFDGRATHAVVNVDDPYGARLLAVIKANSPASMELTEIRPSQVEIKRLDADGSTFLWRNRSVDLPMAGRFNIANALAAAETASILGYDDQAIVTGLSQAARVPGRMDHVPGLPADAPAVLVDYSHTPDSLEKALMSAQELTEGRVIVVFGCGGDRDKTKRPLMGQAAAGVADIAIVTSDNPRSEDPDAIIADTIAGVPTGADSTAEVIVEPDRRAAIHHALTLATADDVVLVAGKGHETTQTFADRVEVFDDRQVVAAFYGAGAQ